MGKDLLLKCISVVLAMVALFALIGAMTAKGSGFIDLSHVVKGLCIIVSLVCGILAYFVWNKSKEKKQ